MLKLIPQQIAEIEARRNAAFAHVHELCKTGNWRMSIPVRNEADSDIIIDNALRDSEVLQASNRDLALAVENLREQLAQWEDGREWWECTKCGKRYHGETWEAPFHASGISDPYCTPCGEGGQ